MPSQYRFLRTHDGVTSFARVTVEVQPSSTWTVTWDNMKYNDSAHPYWGYYNAGLEAGVATAAHEHERRGGEPQRVEIVELYASLLDTRDDAVGCATALATWKALGHPEFDANMEFENGEWHVTFRHLNDRRRSQR